MHDGALLHENGLGDGSWQPRARWPWEQGLVHDSRLTVTEPIKNRHILYPMGITTLTR